MPAANNKPAESQWKYYIFAVAVSAGVFALRFEAGRLFDVRISLPLCGLAAVFVCIWRAGFGPALTATALTAAWYVRDFAGPGPGGAHAWLHYAIYLAEASLVCIFGRRLRIATDRAARGEDWQRHLFETAGEGIWMIGPDGVISQANPRMAEILGCRVDQITGHRLEDFLFPEDLAMERVRLQNRRQGVRDQFDRRLRRSDGSDVWVLACCSLYRSDADTVSLTMMTDITERKKAEQALRQSERKYRELFENILEGVYQTSPDGRILAANPELLRMLGFASPEELNVPGVVRDTFVEAGLHQSLRDRLERDGSYASVEFQLRTRDHRIITVSENARVVRDEKGDVLYYEGTLTDITARIRFEEQLRQAQNMEALGRLAGGIARDFGCIGVSMMTGLQQALEVLPPDSLARPRLDAVAKSMHSAAALTRQILDFSQRQVNTRGGHQPHDEAIDLNGLLLRMEPALIRLANPENSLILSLCEVSVPVLADAGHMRQIVTSFVIHAREFGAGVKKIDLTTRVAAGPAETTGPFVSLSVRCRAAGGGQSGEFSPWIGMATTQAILAQYGGMMTAAVEPYSAEFGYGVRYSLCLPLALGAKVSQLYGEPAELPSPGSDAPSVLLVEEEPLIRTLSRDLLERQGFRVLTAGNSAEAERIARGRETFDVLITAWAPDSGRGTALVRSLRDMRPGLRVLFVAGYSEGSPDSIPPTEGSAILQKPFSGDSLGRKVRSLLERTQVAEI